MSNFLDWLHSTELSEEEKAELQSYSVQERKQFHKRLSFGTAGIRGPVGLGPHRLNRFTIRQVSEAFYRYLADRDPLRLQQCGIAIAYDNRHYSKLFAEEASSLFAYHHIPVYLYAHIRPTPMLSYAVRQLQTVGGIMITASHNPPSDNGFKVYGKDGAQLLPEDAKIIENHLSHLADVLTIPTLSYVHAKRLGKIREIPENIDDAYYSAVQSLSPAVINQPLTIVYTPLHGTGQTVLPRLLQNEKFIHTHLVNEQAAPHPDFPTVSSPNPEDKTAFDLAVQKAKKVSADLIIATDPDADRVGIMIPCQNDYIHLSGNQIGILLLYYLLTEQQKKGTVYTTIVSTNLTKKMAHDFKVKSVETLTGFKYIAEQIEKNQDLLLGFEESYGYLLADFVRDKDGIQTSFFLCHVVAHYKKQGKSLLDVLDDINKQYGYHVNAVISLPISTKKDIIHDFLSLWKDAKLLLDYRTGIDSLPRADVGKVWLNDGSWIAIRPSGTEPKVKIYIEAVGKDKQEAQKKLNGLSKKIERTFHQGQ